MRNVLVGQRRQHGHMHAGRCEHCRGAVVPAGVPEGTCLQPLRQFSFTDRTEPGAQLCQLPSVGSTRGSLLHLPPHHARPTPHALHVECTTVLGVLLHFAQPNAAVVRAPDATAAPARRQHSLVVPPGRSCTERVSDGPSDRHVRHEETSREISPARHNRGELPPFIIPKRTSTFLLCRFPYS